MTLDEFYKEFDKAIKTKKYEKLNASKIRFVDSDNECYCPITLVAKERFDQVFNILDANYVGIRLGLVNSICIKIIRFSDIAVDNPIRNKLLEIINNEIL